MKTCLIDKVKVLLIQFDKSKKMGAIGIAEGERITLAFEYAIRKKLPVIAVVMSGGILINEGTLALMQMIKMANAVKRHSDKGLLYIAVVMKPTLGGTSASFV
ncbi:carboxyl transferase domain-containing protein, partial [uncultured Holdemanella sp.]|uniref:carboxyl transferase domain-containing protein n=1 Tax=uncultured Holdemanella sp. TaxID=1763549 RepID=UPI0025906E86